MASLPHLPKLRQLPQLLQLPQPPRLLQLLQLQASQQQQRKMGQQLGVHVRVNTTVFNVVCVSPGLGGWGGL